MATPPTETTAPPPPTSPAPVGAGSMMGAPPTPPPRQGLSRGAMGVIVVVVVIAVLVLALFLTGVIPGFKSGNGSGSGTSGTSFTTALSTASSSAAAMGGSWVVVAGFGVDSVVPLAVPSNLAGTLGLTCPVTNAPSSPPTLPATTNSYSNGDQTGWVFFLYQSSTSTLLLSIVIGSSATTLGTVVGASCFTNFEDFTGAVGVIDSPAATQAVASDAASFTSATSQASSSLFFLSGYSVTEYGQTVASGPTWNVMYTNCSFTATSGSGSQFVATVNATSGAVTNDGGTHTIGCSSLTITPPPEQKTPLGTAFAMGSPILTTVTSTGAGIGCSTPASGTEYCYEVTIEQASSGVTILNLGFEVRNSEGVAFPVTGISIASIASSTGAGSTTLPATCAGPVCNGGTGTTAWTYGTSGPCASSACGPTEQISSATMLIVIDMGTINPAGNGYELLALAQGPYAGTVTTALP
jgi:hypothetical protein